MPKRQKSLLGYFSLSQTGKHNQCSGGSYARNSQAQPSFTTSVTAGSETVHPAALHPSIQSAGASDIAPSAASLKQKQCVTPNSQDDVLPAMAQLVRSPVRQPKPNIQQHSKDIGSVSQSSTDTDSRGGTVAEDDSVNQYEQQVQQHQVVWLAQAFAPKLLTCCGQQSRGKSASYATTSGCKVLASISWLRYQLWQSARTSQSKRGLQQSQRIERRNGLTACAIEENRLLVPHIRMSQSKCACCSKPDACPCNMNVPGVGLCLSAVAHDVAMIEALLMYRSQTRMSSFL